MTQKSKIKIAIIGVGLMGSSHARDIEALENCELAAICDIQPDRADHYAQLYGVPAFCNHAEMLSQTNLDAVLIATPHYDHPTIAVEAFQRGLHVLTEKPIAVHVQAAQEMIYLGVRTLVAYQDFDYAPIPSAFFSCS